LHQAEQAGQPPVSDSRHLLGLAILLGCVIVISVTCTQRSLEWIGHPFNGFFMARNLVVTPIALRHWSGPQAAIPYRAQLVAIDGQPVTSVTAALAAARRAGPGRVLNYTFARAGKRVTLPIPVMTFTSVDYLTIFGSYLFNGLTFLLMGFLTAFLRPRLAAAQAMLALSLSHGMALVISLADFASFDFRPLYAVAHAATPATVLYLAAAFPTEQPWLHRSKLKLLLLVSTAILAATDIALYDRNPQAWVLYVDASFLWLAVALALGIALMWNQYHTAPNLIAREKIKIVLLGTLVAFAFPAAAIFGGYLMGSELPLRLLPAATWVFPAALAYAVVTRDLFEIDVFLRRATAYVALSGTVFLLYAAILALLSRFSHSLALASSPWFTLFFSLLVVVLVRPSWNWLQRWIDRIFFRTRFDYAETIQNVSQALTRTLNAEEITAQVQRALAETMAPSSCRLLVQSVDDGRFHPSDGSLTQLDCDEDTRRALLAGQILDAPAVAMLSGCRLPRGTALLIPVCFETRLVGILALGTKKSGAAYGPRDFELLRTLANQTAIALRNAASYGRVTELLSSLETRVEERTRELREAQAELQATNQKLRELDRLKTRFFSDASHELRTPLTLVLGPLEEVRRESSSLPAELRRLVDVAHKNAARLLVLTDTLLDLSRLDEGRMQPSYRVEQLGPIVEETAEPFRWLAEQRDIAFRLHSVAEPLLVRCDATMISKVVGNLLANALKFTTRGSIDIDVRASNGRVNVQVVDTGPGIPAAEIPTIFDRYQQASTATQSRFGGSGLGLALVRELTELHGGSVEVESEEGHGTTFTVSLPAVAAENATGRDAPNGRAELPAINLSALAAAGAADAELPAPEPQHSEAPSVLLVEDNPSMLDFLRGLLSRTYSVRCTTNAVAAVEMLRVWRPDIILSDVMMPGPDGVALCRTLKCDESLRHIPLVLLTARASLENKILGLEAGADDYITKPFHPDELKARIHALLRMRQMERELAASHEHLSHAYENLRETQAQLVQAEKMAALGTLVAGVAHEINNPVSFINSSIDLIGRDLAALRETLDRHLPCDGGDPSALAALRKELNCEDRFETLQQNAAICRDGAQRATRIVADLRTFCRTGTGKRELTDIHEILERSLRLLVGESKGRITVHREFGELAPVRCDASAMGQVFLNLLANGMQAIDGLGELFVRTRRKNETVEIEIADTGRGMDESVQSRIFDPFFTTKEVGKGTGLGLSIVRSLVTANGGDIRFRSTPGKGSVFIVSLPSDGAANERN
jgi:signal transduction histidine kinase